jgi:hypothetical protein
MSSLGLGEAAGEFTDVTGADQLARGWVTAGRHGPVIAGCAAAPHPPLRVLAREPVKAGILIVSAWAGRHGGRRAGGRGAGGRGGPGPGWPDFPCGCLPDGAICRTSPVPGRSGSQARPAVRRVIPSQAGGWWRAVRAWPTGAGRDAAAVPLRQPSRVLSADPRRTLGLSGRATGQAVPHRRPDSGPGAPAGKASGLNAASLVVSRRGDQVLPAAKADSSRSLPAG